MSVISDGIKIEEIKVLTIILPKCCSEMGSVGAVVVVETSVGGVSVVISVGGVSVVPSVGGVKVELPAVGGVPVETTVDGVPVVTEEGGVTVVEVVVSVSVGAMLKNSMDIAML